MKLTLATLACLVLAAHAGAAPKSPAEIQSGVADAVGRYVSAVACPRPAIAPAEVLTLAPGIQSGPALPKYAVLWAGDMGCYGGSGSERTHLAIATFNTGQFVVQPELSTPVAAFDSPVRFVTGVVSYSADTLILEGNEYGPDDPRSAPSIPVRFTLRADAKGNWRMVNKVSAAK